MARRRAREETRNEHGNDVQRPREGQREEREREREREEDEHRRKGVGDFSCNYYLLAP